MLGLKRLKALDEAIEDETSLAECADQLAKIHKQLIAAPYQLLVVSEARYQDEIGSALNKIWREDNPPRIDSSKFQPRPVAKLVNQAWVTSTEVNFCAQAYLTVPADHPDAPALIVLGRFLQNGYLHRAIREQGGAYGSGASYDANTGAFRFYSYRDPRLAETLEDFSESLRWLQRHPHEYHALEEAILGVISAIDRPSSPAGEAIKTFMASLNGRTPDYRRRLRQHVLGVTLEDLKRVAATYLAAKPVSTAVVTDRRTIEKYHSLDLEVLVL